MSAVQLHIDWTKAVHARENNPESERHLKRNIYHFTGQCAVVLSLLEKGIRLTSRDAMLTYNIGHLARRIKDLKEAGVNIQDRFVKDEDGNETRFKEYYITKK